MCACGSCHNYLTCWTPTPFLNKDLDRACEIFIDNWALSLPHDSHLHLTVHIEQLPIPAGASELVAGAVHNYYAYKIDLVRGERAGCCARRLSLAVGPAFIAASDF